VKSNTKAHSERLRRAFFPVYFSWAVGSFPTHFQVEKKALKNRIVHGVKKGREPWGASSGGGLGEVVEYTGSLPATNSPTTTKKKRLLCLLNLPLSLGLTFVVGAYHPLYAES
jgi:hypothetical protein